jgi:hypothetical protein
MNNINRTHWIGMLALTALFGLLTAPVGALTMPTTDLALWLKADAITGVNDGDPLTSWTNSSPVAYSVTASSGEEPAYVAASASFAGKPVVRFQPGEGGTKKLTVPDFVMAGPDMTVIVAGYQSGTYGFVIRHGPNAWESPGFALYYGAASDFIINRTGVKYGSFGPLALSAPAFTVFQCNATANEWPAAWTNGTPLPRTGQGTWDSVTGGATDTLTIMNGAQGDIAEVLVYSTALSQTDRQLAEGLLAWKYGMQASLPDDHPWKNTDPVGATDIPPTVAITSPANNSSLLPGTVTINASASDVEGDIAKVVFYTNGVYIGESTSVPYSMEWTASVVGTYSLTARAWDDQGSSNLSAIVTVVVALPPPPPPPPGNMPTAGLALWLKADTITGKSNGDPLSSWDNSSPVTYLDYLVSAGPGEEPTYVAGSASFGGKPAVQFDGTDKLTVLNFVMGTPDMTVIVVGTYSGAGFGMAQGPNVWASPGFALYYGSPPAGAPPASTFIINRGSNGDSYGQRVGLDLSAPAVSVFQYSATVNAWPAWTNGTPLPEESKGYAGAGPPVTGGATDTLTIMNGGQGDIAEVLVYSTALSQTDRQMAEGLLAWKYGMQASLPADHPWKSVNPSGERRTGALIVIQ